MHERTAKPTIEDVARVAGLSRGTVSRVLNGGRYVSPVALAAVQKAMASTGYVVNASARSLATSRTNCFAFLLSEPTEQLFEDPNFASLLRACTTELASLDMTLILLIASSAPDTDRILRYLRSGHVDGVILVSTHANDPLAAELVDRGIPTVRCGAPAASHVVLPSVAADERAGAQLMTRHLRDRGYRRIAIITGPLDAVGSAERRDGWADVLGDEADPALTEAAAEYSLTAGQQAAHALLDRRGDVDAIFAASDLLASGVAIALAERGLSIPGDVALGGFDDSRIATAMRPSLTTVRQSLQRVGGELARLVVRVAGGGDPISVTVPVELVVREST